MDIQQFLEFEDILGWADNCNMRVRYAIIQEGGEWHGFAYVMRAEDIGWILSNLIKCTSGVLIAKLETREGGHNA